MERKGRSDIGNIASEESHDDENTNETTDEDEEQQPSAAATTVSKPSDAVGTAGPKSLAVSATFVVKAGEDDGASSSGNDDDDDDAEADSKPPAVDKSSSPAEGEGGDYADPNVAAEDEKEVEDIIGIGTPTRHAPRQGLWLKEQVSLEELEASGVNANDVLLGRGVPLQKHAGNVRMHRIVNDVRARYSEASRRDKPGIIRAVVSQVKKGGYRFMKRPPQTDSESNPSRADENARRSRLWVEASDEEAYEKISHALRGKRRSRRGQVAAAIGEIALRREAQSQQQQRQQQAGALPPNRSIVSSSGSAFSGTNIGSSPLRYPVIMSSMQGAGQYPGLPPHPGLSQHSTLLQQQASQGQLPVAILQQLLPFLSATGGQNPSLLGQSQPMGLPSFVPQLSASSANQSLQPSSLDLNTSILASLAASGALGQGPRQQHQQLAAAAAAQYQQPPQASNSHLTQQLLFALQQAQQQQQLHQQPRSLPQQQVIQLPIVLQIPTGNTGAGAASLTSPLNAAILQSLLLSGLGCTSGNSNNTTGASTLHSSSTNAAGRSDPGGSRNSPGSGPPSGDPPRGG